MVLLAVAMQVAAAIPAQSCEARPCPDIPVLAWAGAPAARFPAVRPEGSTAVTASGDPAVAIALTAAGRVAEPGTPSEGARLRPSPAAGGQLLFEYSDGYYARLSLHRLASYGTLPLFAVQFIAGRELLNNVDHAAGWARAVHGPAAAGVAGLFLVNTVTGGLNIIEGVRDPNDRGWRVAHSLLMLAADAGFVWTGVTATGAGRYRPDSNELRTQHRTVALGSMGVATLGYLMMLSPFRH